MAVRGAEAGLALDLVAHLIQEANYQRRIATDRPAESK